MKPDDFVCLCFHVTRRKVVNFIRVEKPKRPSQLSQCFGAGTGCGWCRPYLERLLDESLTRSETPKLQLEDTPEDSIGKPADELDVSFEEYKKSRSDYIRQGEGTPPSGAIGIDQTNESDPL